MDNKQTTIEQQQQVNRKRKHTDNCDQIVEQIFTEAAILANQQKNEINENKSSKRPKILKLEPTDEQPEIICSFCNLVFNSKAKLIMHEYKYHGNGSSTECPICCKLIFF